MHEVLVNRLGGLSLPRKSVVRLTDRPDMTLDVYRGRKTTIQPIQPNRSATLNKNQKNCKQNVYFQFGLTASEGYMCFTIELACAACTYQLHAAASSL